MASACTNGDDTVCQVHSNCQPGQYQTTEPTADADRGCADCADGTFSTAPNAASCDAVTVCDEDSYESQAATATSDRICARVSNCTDEEFEAAAPTATADRDCRPFTVCRDDERELAPPTPTSDRECGPYPEPNAGQIIISEIMYNPRNVADGDGEWFELYNPTTETVSLLGLTLSDGALDDEETDQITFTREALIGTGNYLVAPQSYVVLGVNADVETNGGVAVDYAYAGFGLTNNNGALVITNSAGETVDALFWENGTLTSADGTVLGESLDSAGKSMSRSGDGSGEWCRGSAALGDSDFGTPGTANSSCQCLETEFFNGIDCQALTVCGENASEVAAPTASSDRECICNPPYMGDGIVCGGEENLVDYCGLQSPAEIRDVAEGTETAVYVRIYEEGITTVTDLVDSNESVLVQVGYGASTTDPLMIRAGVGSTPLQTRHTDRGPEHSGNNDEYMGLLPAPSPYQLSGMILLPAFPLMVV